MILTLPDALPPGRVTALRQASGVVEASLGAMVIDDLNAEPRFQLFANPRHFSSFEVSEVGPGDEWQHPTSHSAHEHWRVDLVAFVFLTEPSQSAGGALLIDTGYGPESYKDVSGTVIVSPASAIHRLETVSDGHMRFAVGLIESRVHDGRAREILYDIGCAVGYFDVMGVHTAEVDALRRCQQRLLRECATS